MGPYPSSDRAVEKADHRHRRLLRARRERPRRRRTAEQRDELAASDESCHLIPPAGRLRPNDSTVVPACLKTGNRPAPLERPRPAGAPYDFDETDTPMEGA